MSEDVPGHTRYAQEIAFALHESLGGRHAAIKTVVGWTGANERTVKNWLSGTYGPSGPHLVGLAKHSSAVLESFLLMSRREEFLVANRLAVTERSVVDLLEAVRRMSHGGGTGLY